MSTPEIKFKDFLKRYSITFVLGNIKIDSDSLSNFISDCLVNPTLENKEENKNEKVKISSMIPETNDADYLIINTKDSSEFEELTYKKLLNRNYSKYPKGIIVVLTFDNLIDMEIPFNEMQILTRYRIPVLYCGISDEEINYKIKMINQDFYDDCLRLNPPEDPKYLHISNLMTFKYKLKERLIDMTKNTNTIEVFCYYNEENRTQWLKLIKHCEDIEKFYEQMTSGQKLSYNNDDLYVY